MHIPPPQIQLTPPQKSLMETGGRFVKNMTLFPVSIEAFMPKITAVLLCPIQISGLLFL